MPILSLIQQVPSVMQCFYLRHNETLGPNTFSYGHKASLLDATGQNFSFGHNSSLSYEIVYVKELMLELRKFMAQDFMIESD